MPHSETTKHTLDTISPDLQGILDAVPSYVLLVDSQHHIVAANRAICQSTGLPMEAILGAYCPKLIHGVEGTFPGCPMEEAATTGQAVEREVFDQGSGRWLLSCMYPTEFETPAGLPIYYHKVDDITEAKRTEDELAQTIEVQTTINAMLRVSLTGAPLDVQLDLLIQHITGIPWLTLEPTGSIFLVEQQPETLVLKAQQGMSAHLLTACATVPFGRCMCGRAAQTREIVFADCVDERHDVRYEGMRPHGHYCVPILSGDQVLGVINLYLKAGASRSSKAESFLRAMANALAGIIEHKRLQEQYLQAQKMEVVGRLAGGVAHDFNNLLTVISGYTEFTMESMPEDSLERSWLSEVLLAAENATAISRQLLAFSRQRKPGRQLLHMNDVISLTTKMLTLLAGESVDLKIELDPRVGLIQADAGHIEQIVVNLAVNAHDAMPDGGTLVITTQNATVAESLGPGAPPAGEYVLLTVADTGVGMSPEIQKRIFEPFYTTKAVGKGTGLGLATVQSVVQQNDGFVQVESEPGVGTTFYVYFPQQVETELAQEKPSTGVLPRGHEVVLVVEDQRKVRTLVAEMLRLLGYHVIEASGTPEALQAIETSKKPIQAVLADVIMPGIGGQELVEDLLAAHPDLAVVYMSGYADDRVAPDDLARAGALFLSKPFTFDALAHVIRQALDAA